MKDLPIFPPGVELLFTSKYIIIHDSQQMEGSSLKKIRRKFKDLNVKLLGLKYRKWISVMEVAQC